MALVPGAAAGAESNAGAAAARTGGGEPTHGGALVTVARGRFAEPVAHEELPSSR